MDLSTLIFDQLFGFTPKKAIRFFLARMWVGYAFDAGEFAFLWIHVGMIWKSENWRYGFYAYVGTLGLIGLLLTFTLVFCVLRGPNADGRIHKIYKKIPYLMGYFKLSGAVNAGIIFFMLFFSGKKDEPEVLALEIVTGIDMGVDLLQMGLGLAGFNSQRICAKDHNRVKHEESVISRAPVASSFRKSRK